METLAWWKEIVQKEIKIVRYDFTMEDIENHFHNKHAHHFFNIIKKNPNGSLKTLEELNQTMGLINNSIPRL